MLTGLTRYRLGWRKKVVLQVSEWRRTYAPGRAPWLDGYQAIWRDATFQDVINLERLNFSGEAPKIDPPARPPSRREPTPITPSPDPDFYDIGMAAERGIDYRFLGVTGEEND